MHSHKSIRQLGILLVLTASSVGSHGQSVAATQPAAVRLPNPNSFGTAADKESKALPGTSQFILGAADVIRVNVWKNPDLSQTITVGPDAFVALPLLGEVHVVGMTANQLAQELSSKYSAYVVSAQVTVSVVDIRSRQVYVVGQVGKPGGYPLIAPITVLQLIAQTGGLNTFANRKEIVILRGSNGNVQRLKFNYKSAVHADSMQNIFGGVPRAFCTTTRRSRWPRS
jgi:polysaccharide biosynthesis/export protein